jgi:hypothetical protein
MPQKLYRQEIKQLLSPTQTLLLQQRISAILQPDAHSGADGSYYIRSIYFDTLSDRAYTEKEAGISEREKIRIRFYDFQDKVIKLERKEKRENLIYKDSLSISREAAEAALNGDYTPLLSCRSPLADYVYSLAASEGLHPTVVVDYVRKAYLYPVGNVRITFDTALQAGRTDIPLWQAGNVFDVLEGNTILEIKFNHYLPEHIRQVLSSVPGERMALSKYTLCRQNLLLKQGDYLGGKQ